MLCGATVGSIIGFLLAAPIYFACEKLLGDKQWVKVAALLLGLAVCYAFGTAWFMVVYTRTTEPVAVGTALGWCVLPYILPDLAKLALAWGLEAALKKAIKI